MAQIRPFRAIRYTRTDTSDVIAPPYDILSEEDKQALLKKDRHNIVAIDLPHTPPKTAGPDSAYERAAGELTRWLDTRCLARDEKPAIYAYHQTYGLGGRTLTRRKFFARLRLEEFGSGSVFPHEQTFGGPKEDRLKLTTATRCNVSPIFGLYPDPNNAVSAVIEAAIGREPDQKAVLGGVQNKLWAITDETTIRKICGLLADKNIFIADGHHRYGTGLNHRKQYVKENGEPAADDPVNFVLAVLGGMEDPGATIQPYFRSIVDVPDMTADDLRGALTDAFTWAPIGLPATPDDLAKALAAASPQALALYVAKNDLCAVLAPKNEDLLATCAPDRKPAWRRLAYAILHRYIVDEVISPKFAGGQAATIHYHKTMHEAIDDAKEHDGIAALMPATTMAQLRDICTAGELMPQKSTYFYPKLATGMVINPLYE
ncbi:MAG: DUF1015 domain-containing protein [Phycisphaerae bacterium]|nr:DUF1015 domain-containing protein [Phycisphaerae bacterium]